EAELERAELPFRDAGRAFERPPRKGVRVHEDRALVARLRIFELAPVDLLPAGLERVLVLAAGAGTGKVHAVAEFACLLQLDDRRFTLGGARIAGEARAAGLQDDDQRLLALDRGWSVRRALGEVSEHAFGHGAVAVVAGGAFELQPDLLEIMLV